MTAPSQELASLLCHVSYNSAMASPVGEKEPGDIAVFASEYHSPYLPLLGHPHAGLLSTLC